MPSHRHGLKEGELYTLLAKKTPRNFDNILQQASKYINLVEGVKLKKSVMPGMVGNHDR